MAADLNIVDLIRLAAMTQADPGAVTPAKPGETPPKPGDAKDPEGTILNGDGSKWMPPGVWIWPDGRRSYPSSPDWPAERVPPGTPGYRQPGGGNGGPPVVLPPGPLPPAPPAPPGTDYPPVYVPPSPPAPPGNGNGGGYTGKLEDIPVLKAAHSITIGQQGTQELSPEWVPAIMALLDAIMSNTDLRAWIMSAIRVPGTPTDGTPAMDRDSCWLLMHELPKWMHKPITRFRCGSSNPIGLDKEQQNFLLALMVAHSDADLTGHPCCDAGLAPRCCPPAHNGYGVPPNEQRTPAPITRAPGTMYGTRR